MALTEENINFTLTRKYHNLYLAMWKVFSVKRAGSSLLLTLIHQGIKHKNNQSILFVVANLHLENECSPQHIGFSTFS